ncbi:hypothetical protein AGMMS49992_31730 [Clostridia bacterium]|nr:hypothetical protein AGMMS49992_31730 [Clostridia bacterium]
MVDITQMEVIIVMSGEEYLNRYDKRQEITYKTQDNDFLYTEYDLMEYYANKEIGTLILVNPDNPSGNYLYKDSVLVLLDWCRNNKIRLILDESFADFSDEDNNTLIQEKYIEKYTNIVIIKSISKTYGVPGLRLGVLVSGDIDLVNKIKSDVSIWNINSISEHFMQIEAKYSNEYRNALQMVKDERNRFVKKLNTIDTIKVYPSQANFVMIELISRVTANELTNILYRKYNIIIKNLSSKISYNNRQYIRVAIKNMSENEYFFNSIRTELVIRAKGAY